MRFKPNGDYDSTFGGSGYVTTSFSVFTSDVKAVFIDSNNRIVAAGRLQYGPNCEGTEVDYGLARYSQDGSLDVSFAGGKQTIDIYGGKDNLKGLAIQQDGKIVIGGTAFSSDMTVKHFALIRFNPDGARDPSFGIVGNGVVTTDFFGLGSYGYGLALQPSDGKILVSGTVYGNPNGPASGEVAVARYWPCWIENSTESKRHEVHRALPMKNRNDLQAPAEGVMAASLLADKSLHPAWRAFVRYCAELQHGEIELLKIQDGLPVLAEVTRKKVKFAP
jgi:uncharacterized delta-60 repeat protein